MSDYDPVFGSEIPYIDTEETLINTADEEYIRCLIEHILAEQLPKREVFFEEGERFDTVTQKAEFRLPSGDRLLLEHGLGTFPDEPESSYPFWHATHYRAVAHTDHGLAIQEVSFDFSPELFEPCYDDVVCSFSMKISNIAAEGEDSAQTVALSELLGSFAEDLSPSSLEEFVMSITLSSEVGAEDELFARHQGDLSDRELEDAMTVYGQAMHRWLMSQIIEIDPRNALPANQRWSNLT